MSNLVALNQYLLPFAPFLQMEGVSDICINRPKEIWVEKGGQFRKFDAPELNIDFLWKFAQLVAEANEREISRENPILSATLPNGLRVQFVIEPACERGSFICAIRQKAMHDIQLQDFFPKMELEPISQKNILLEAYLKKDYLQFLKLAVLHKKNIIISGSTSSGKTACLNALVDFIPPEQRLISVESDREFICRHLNAVHLLASQDGIALSNVTMLDLLKATLRLRPDRILLSELRAEEAFAYLRAINSGHPGSITTMHADCPLSCFDQLAFMVMQAKTTLSKQEIISYAKSIINVIVQIKKSEAGIRHISEIYFDEANKV